MIEAFRSCLKLDEAAIKKVAEVLNSSDSFVVTCHVRPDGDAVGSILGLGLALKDAGRGAVIYTEEPIPERLAFLPGSEFVVSGAAPMPERFILVVLDCNEPVRIGARFAELVEKASGVVVLDHHLAKILDSWGGKISVSYIEPGVFATGAIVYLVIEELGWPISDTVASNIYAAILSDTGCFCHSNTNEAAFLMAAKMVGHGADPYAIANGLYQNYSVARQRLLALALKTLELKGRDRIGLMQVTPDMFKICGASESDTDDFVGYVRALRSVEVAVFIKEVHEGQTYVSLRSKSFYNVSELAQEFGGGGHVRAAGFRMAASASEVRGLLLNRLIQDFDALGGTDVGD
ncbi:DHH family phosphoesterase [Dissulfurimicrobium hydrothermale]|uniref:DHH family phosphoesterase n=1 Tax=Dissulfurimicrobium hydrothermale TaxID=1750598 RepID=UPI001EDA98CF|nr:bifunctional oligoribonuclease/PAP phosphatase NrnA [Dissulfurimicrobium hydrothermale]UKL14023.1 bifunctional oligoribonuclease/PAP phosphatase NrnA [Dissulfurimicrobium hydrothermale]